MRKLVLLTAAAAAAIAVLAIPASASHSWGGYHWARTANPFTLNLDANLTADWKPFLTTASSDWNQSTVLKTTIVDGQPTKRCRAVAGRVEVCNGTYGNNGWLGLASIWITGGTHITQGTVKVNDTYFSNYTYNNPNEKLHVICQEVGHTFGLDHQSTDGSSQNTCMDYFSNTGLNASSTLSTHPNDHDYAELVTIYGHLDSTTTISASSRSLPDAVPSFSPASQKRRDVYVDRLPNGDELVTFVIWAD